jgi:elongation factor P--beta-lysine ligase
VIPSSYRPAIEAAAQAVEKREPEKSLRRARESAEAVIKVASGVALGNDRLVCLADVLALLRDDGDVVDFATAARIERHFGRAS